MNIKLCTSNVKPSNIPVDADLNLKLGDFGQARILYDHTFNLQTTRIAGILSFLAPEFTKTGKATTSTDMYRYMVHLILKVFCCRRPIEHQNSRGELMKAVDPALDFCDPDEAKLVLCFGLLCLHPVPNYRPSMRTIVQLLLGDASCYPVIFKSEFKL